MLWIVVLPKFNIVKLEGKELKIAEEMEKNANKCLKFKNLWFLAS
ncbi:MAG: hypothetical protein Q4A62_06550 [Eikenella sp.]|nr:hypothetical protein [Eikenella sp.]